MEQVHNIKYLRKFKGKSLRGIVAATGYHFNTVKKYVEKDNFNLELNPGKRKPRKLAAYAELIDSWLEADLHAKPKQRHTAQRVYNRLREQFPDFDVSDRSVRAYVSKRKKELGLAEEGYLPLEHPPSEAQIDFGAAQFIEKGILYDGYYLNLSFPYSNGGYLQLFKAENQECLLEGLKNILEQAFNSQLLKTCDADMNRKHYKKPNLICALFAEDKAAMDKLPEVPFQVYRLEPVKADKYGKVRFENKLYSTSPEYAGKDMWLKAGAYAVEVMNHNYQTVIRHPRLYGQQSESMVWGPYLKLMARRPAALKYTGFFKELPTTIQDYFAKCDYTEKKKSLNLLLSMLQDTDITAAEKAFAESCRRELINADSLLAIYNHQNSHLPEDTFLRFPPQLPEVQKYSTNFRAYDLLLKGGEQRWKQ